MFSYFFFFFLFQVLSMLTLFFVFIYLISFSFSSIGRHFSATMERLIDNEKFKLNEGKHTSTVKKNTKKKKNERVKHTRCSFAVAVEQVVSFRLWPLLACWSQWIEWRNRNERQEVNRLNLQRIKWFNYDRPSIFSLHFFPFRFKLDKHTHTHTNTRARWKKRR